MSRQDRGHPMTAHEPADLDELRRLEAARTSLEARCDSLSLARQPLTDVVNELDANARAIARRLPGLLDRLEAAEAERDEARGERPSGFWSQRQWEDWSNELAILIPDDTAYGNPEGAQESIIEDTLRGLLAENTSLRERLAKVETLDRGHVTPGCTFPDAPCICSVPLFVLRAALAEGGA